MLDPANFELVYLSAWRGCDSPSARAVALSSVSYVLNAISAEMSKDAATEATWKEWLAEMLVKHSRDAQKTE